MDDVLAESAEAPDTLAPLLKAVRARRRRRQLAPIAVAAMCVALGLVWRAGPLSESRRSGNGDDVAAVAGPAARAAETDPADDGTQVAASPVAPGMDDRIRSTAMGSGVVVRTMSGPLVVTRLSTRADASLRLSDEELLQLAGGRGVALALMEDGRKQLFFADAPPSRPRLEP